jgi:hypothetical protein
MAKTTLKDFQLFKDCADRWIQKLSICNWAFYYEHKKLDGKYAETIWSSVDMIATIRLSKDWDDLRPKNDTEIDRLALHEVLHVLLAPLVSQAEWRYASQDGIITVEHSIVRSLENMLL